MNLTETTTLTSADFPVAEFGEHMRLGSGFADDGGQNALLESCLRAAMGAIEARTGKILIARSFEWRVYIWRREDGGQALPVSPVNAITQLIIYQAKGSPTYINSTLFGLVPDIQRPRLVALEGELPEIPEYGSAQVSFDAGYGIWEDIPSALKQAVFLLAATYYEHRDEMVAKAGQMPFGVMALIEPYRRLRLGGAA